MAASRTNFERRNSEINPTFGPAECAKRLHKLICIYILSPCCPPSGKGKDGDTKETVGDSKGTVGGQQGDRKGTGRGQEDDKKGTRRREDGDKRGLQGDKT